MIELDGKFIFVGGIHGVGKTTICSKISNELAIEYLGASRVINEYKAQHSLDNNKITTQKEVDANQDILLTALKEKTKKNNIYLLDGHFTLLSSEGKIKRLPFRVFEAMRPILIIVLIDDVENIASRLQHRDNIDISISLLNRMQLNEINYGDYISKKLEIPFYKIMMLDYDRLLTIVQQAKKIVCGVDPFKGTL